MSQTERLDKILAHRALGSRSDVKKIIRSGRVTVDGEVVKRSDHRVAATQEIRVDDIAVMALPVVLVWHKPTGVVSTLRDPFGRADLSTVLPPEFRGQYHPVGRLDADTSGLLLFSRSGALTQWLLHPRRAIQRRYEATVQIEPDNRLVERLNEGVETSLGRFTAEVELLDGYLIRLSVREGKHRMVRRLLANSGHPVETLHRLSYGPFEIQDLALGQFRPAMANEIDRLSHQDAPGLS